MPDTTDLLQFLGNGEISLTVGSKPILLRQPLIKEWRSFIADFTEAERRVILSTSDLRETLGYDPDEEIEDLTQHEETQGPAFATVLCRIIRLLGGVSIEPGDLPTWCATGSVIVAMEYHWTHIPLAIGATPPEMVAPRNLMEKMGVPTTTRETNALLEQLSQAGP